MFLRTSDKQSMSKKQEHKWSLVGGVVFVVANFLLIWSRLLYICGLGDTLGCEDFFTDAFFMNFPASSLVGFLTILPAMILGIWFPNLIIVYREVVYFRYFIILVSGIIQYFTLGVLSGFIAYKIFNYAKSKRSGNKA